MISLNANGLRSVLKRRAIFNDLRNSKSYIIFIQETHCTTSEEKIWLSEWGGPGYFSHGRSNARGVAILFSRNFNPKIHEQIADEDGRLLILQIQRGDNMVTLANLYVPTQNEAKDQDSFLGKLEQTLANIEVHTLLLGGDLNVQLDRYDKKQSRRSTHLDAYVAKIKSLLEDYSLTDIWKAKYPALLSPQASSKITPHPLSDHCLLTLQIKFAETNRGPGYWRFDNLLLTEQSFVTEMSDHITEIQTETPSNPNLMWEWIKYKIQDFCISYTINRNRRRKQQVKDLEDRLNTLAEEHDLIGSPDIIVEVQSIKRELGEIRETKASAAIFRAKTRWASQGEKPSPRTRKKKHEE